jgi:predicted nucleotidyltransferase
LNILSKLRTDHIIKLFLFSVLIALGASSFLVYTPVTQTAGPFIEETNASLIGVNGDDCGGVAWGDYDNDGDLDILLTGWTGSSRVTKIYQNDGGGTFSDINASLPTVSTGSVAWGDYDNDDDLDILLVGNVFPGRIAKVYRNDGGGNFSDIGAGFTGVNNGSVAWGDYDNDGDLDILLTGTATGGSEGAVARVYRNDGGGNFSNISTGLTGVYLGSAAWGDYDNDGDLDIVLTGVDSSSNNISKVYRNDGGRNFSDISAGLMGLSASSVAWGDYDNDGDLDILLIGLNGPPYYFVKLYRNDGGGTFSDVPVSLPGLTNGSIDWGDYDNDGDLDILLTGTNGYPNGVTKVYRNDGGGTFSDISASLTGVWTSSAAWGDYDNDGDLDILLAGLDSSSNRITKVYRNDIGTANTSPQIPDNLHAAVNGATVNLNWDAVTDTQTITQTGLTYNLRVGSSPSLNDVLSPMAFTSVISNGLRLLPALGNTNHRLTATLTLSSGTYYWSVQAIDTAFAGSPFSTENSFTIPASDSGANNHYLPIIVKNEN